MKPFLKRKPWERNQKMMNKKANLGDFVTLIVSTIIISAILFIFFYFSSLIADFKFNKNAEIAVSYSDKGQALTSLTAFLQTPIKIILNFEEPEETEISIADLIRLNEVLPGGDTILKEQVEKAFQPFGRCYFFKKAEVEAGNSAIRDEMAVLNLPVNINTNVEVGLAVNSKCMGDLKK